MPAAVSTASCPAPLIWKKIRLWFLSWISLSSRRRDSSIVRYARSRSSAVRPSQRALEPVAVAVRASGLDASVEAFMSGKIISPGPDAIIRAKSHHGRDIYRHEHSDPVRLYRWDEIALEKVTEMISRKIITGEREMVTQIYLKRGAIVPMHSHESEQMTYVLQGGLRFLINGEEITVREGEVLHIPSWVPHQAEAIDDTFEMDIFSPIRHDWLDGTDKYFHDKPTEKLTVVSSLPVASWQS